jgi:hypothetical protein
VAARIGDNALADVKVLANWLSACARTPTPAARSVHGRPFFGERLEHFGCFVANDAFAFRHGPDQTTKHRHPAQSEVGAAIVDADLRVHLQHGVVLFVVFGSQLTIAAACNNTDRGIHARFCLRGTGRSGGRLVRRRSAAIAGSTGDGPSIRCSEQDVNCYRRENPLIRDSKTLPVRARSPAANRYSPCFGIIRHVVAAVARANQRVLIRPHNMAG